MTPQSLLEYLRYLAQAHRVNEELFRVPAAPHLPGPNRRPVCLPIAVSAQDVIELCDYVAAREEKEKNLQLQLDECLRQSY